MKQFLLFRFTQWYPRGGLNDVWGTYDTLEEAMEYFEEWKKYMIDSDPDFKLDDQDYYCFYIWDRVNDVKTNLISYD